MAIISPHHKRWTTEQWEKHLGHQVRRARLTADWSQAFLAKQANVSLNTVKNLEAGSGSSLRSLVRVVRALGLESWLDELSPDPGVDPIALADAMRKSQPRERASRQNQG